MLIIDCYNLLHTTMPQPLAGLDEATLVRLVAASTHRHARIVCDGVEKSHAPTSLSVDDVLLMYAGPGKSADDVIIELINADSAPRKLTVVSNDHQIQRAATRRRAKSQSCEAFIGMLMRVARRGVRPRGHGEGRAKPESMGDTQYWLREFGFNDSDE